MRGGFGIEEDNLMIALYLESIDDFGLFRDNRQVSLQGLA
jgi:hypothetical protein